MTRRRPAESGCAAPRIGYDDSPIVEHVDLTVRAGRGRRRPRLERLGQDARWPAGLLGLAQVLDGEVEVLGTPGRPAPRPRAGRLRPAAPHGERSACRPRSGRSSASGRLAAPRPVPAARAPPTAPPWRDAVAAVGLSDRLDDPVASLSGGSSAACWSRGRWRPSRTADHGRADGRRGRRQPAGAGRRPGGRVGRAARTIVVVTHEIGPLTGVLGRAVVVDHGRIRYDGPLAGARALVRPADHHHGPESPTGPGATGYRLDQPRVTAEPSTGDGGR